MPWNEKVWDALNNIYWTPRLIGMKSKKEGQTGARSYLRTLKAKRLREYLETQEEVLNYFFNITFAIAADAVTSRILCSPFGYKDAGPFASYGRESSCLKYTESLTQPDGLFVSSTSVVGTELKVHASSSVEQVAKYAGVISCVEKESHVRENVALLYIVPQHSITRLWSDIGFADPREKVSLAACQSRKCPEGFAQKIPSKTLQAFAKKKLDLESSLQRLQVAVVSWTSLRDKIAELEREPLGDQTLQRLLEGFRLQIETHRGTGIVNTAAAGA